jgi:hypothetical protein
MAETLPRPHRAAAFGWGYNNSDGLGLGHSARAYQLGDHTTKTRLGWARVPLPEGTVVTGVQAGTDHVLAVAAERVAGRVPAEPGAGPGDFRVADELARQSVPGSVRGSPNRGITLAPKPVIAVMRSSAVVTTSSP